MTDALLVTAARLLEREADTLRMSYQVDGQWLASDEWEAHANHDEMLRVAKQLRERAKETTA